MDYPDGTLDAATAPDPDTLVDARTELLGRAMDLIDAARADNTRRAYASDWSHFETFCERLDLAPLPADPLDVALYLAHLNEVGHAKSTISRRTAANADRHSQTGHDSPTTDHTVRQVMKGIRRSDTRARDAKRALTPPELRRLLAASDHSITALRDNAVLLTGFLGALRRSELVALNVDDLTLTDDGYRALVRRSKTDQEGDGRDIALPYTSEQALCPVTAIAAWLDAAAIDDGPLFRRVRRGGHVTGDRLTGQSVANIIKNRATVAGIDPDDLAAHSLRSGFITLAAGQGLSERAIARQTGHRSSQVLRSYIQTATVFDDNAVTELNL